MNLCKSYRITVYRTPGWWGLSRQHRDPDSKVNVANVAPTWVLSAPGRPHVGPMDVAIRARIPLRADISCLNWQKWKTHNICIHLQYMCVCNVIGFNHGLPWCVKYMARGPPVATKPDGEAGGFCGDRGPEGHVFHTSRQAMIKTYYSTSIGKNMVQNCIYFTQMKLTTTAIDDSNRRWNKLGLGCSREVTAPLILIFKSLFLWLNIGRHFKGITQFHNCHSPKHTSKKYYLVINIFRKICTKIIT